MSRTNPPTVLELRPNAAAFLDLLVELGHLDDAMLQTVNDRLLDSDGVPTDGVPTSGAQRGVSIMDLKRVAAVIIQDNLGGTDPEYQRAVQREWPLLFH